MEKKTITSQERNYAKAQIKANNSANGSKYIKPSFSGLGWSYNQPSPATMKV